MFDKANSAFVAVLGVFLLLSALCSAQTQNYVAKFDIVGTANTNSSLFDNGNVGIGTTSPESLLHVSGGQIDVSPNGGNFNEGVRIHPSANGYSDIQLGAVAGASGTGTGQWSIEDTPNYTLGFWYNGNSSIFNITSAGNVGIGTTSPSVPLEISTTAGGNPVVQKIVRTGGNAGGEGPVLEFDDFLDSVPQGHIYTSLYNIPSAANAVGKLILGSHGNAAATSSSFNDELTLFNGNVGIGTADPGERLELSGNLKMSGAGSHITFPDSSTQATAWTGVLCGGDYAESVDVSGDRKHYEPGDVMVIDPDQPGKFLKSAEPYSTGVTGVFATKPGVIGRRQTTDLKASTTEVPMAMIGIVPTRVSAENGPIKPGDLLVTSSTPGYAMK